MASSPEPRRATALLFMHIPKTAGTTLREALDAVFASSERMYLYPEADLEGAVHPRDFGRLPASERDRPDLIMGHFGFGLHEAITRPARYVTMLRDPLDRVVSLYYHYKTLTPGTPGSPGKDEQELIRVGDMSLEEWVFEAKRPALDNGMVRQLVGYRGVPFGRCPDELLEEALENISRHFDAVLIRGRMKQSAEMLGKLVGTRLPTLRRANVNPDRERLDAIDPGLRMRIRELNRLDNDLFRRMLDAFPHSYDRVMQGHPATPGDTRRVVVAGPPLAAKAAPAPQRPRARLAVRDQTLVFMHIAKTGGTSLRGVFSRAYARDERAFIYDPADLRGALTRDQLADLDEETRERLRLVMGHMPYGIHRVVGRPCRYLTVVRDPVDRVVSLYYHYRHRRSWRSPRTPARDEHQPSTRSSLSLEEWVFGQNRLALDNGMTRNLAARQRVRFGQCPDDLLDEALAHVDGHFAAMLVADRLDESHDLLEVITGRRLGAVKHANVNRRRPSLDELDPRLLARIRKLNRLDARLYDVAQQRAAELLGQ